ncbi:MAG: hypothetical protein M1376_22115 [Planctomycetes bacterium]|nr:hypothetical protein [Planctomycetota bacterium]
MKSNFCNKTTAWLLLAGLVVGSWPTTGRSQESSRRDRYRRDFTDRIRSMRPGTDRPETGTQAGPTRPDSTRPGTATQPGPARPQSAPSGTTPAVPPASKDGQAGRTTKQAEPTRAPAPAARRPRSERGEQWAKYNIILDRNMFSRERVPSRPQDAVAERPKVVPNPESYLLLKGVVQENNQFLAFVEDKRTGTVLRLREGDSVARGTVKSLTLDGLQYQFQDKTISVSLGSDLEGGSGALTASDLASFSSMAAPAASSPGSSAPSADEAEILKRLMEQRQQQLGR